MSVPTAALEAERAAAKAGVREQFAGKAGEYSAWVLDRPLTEGLFERFVEELEPRLRGRAGAQVLDLASASGEPAATLAAALPLAAVHATDLTPEFVALGRARLARLGLANVVCEQADAEALGQYADASFDAVTCCMGLMFMPNVDAALAESCRVLRPGGTFVAAVYQGEGRQPFFPFLGSLAAEIAPEPESEQAEPSPYHPCRFGDPAPLLAAASAAGLADIECRELSLAYCLSADDWWPCLTSCGDMPVKAALERAAAAADCSGRDVGGEAQQLAERRMRERGWLQPDGSVFCPGNMAWFVVACKPH